MEGGQHVQNHHSFNTNHLHSLDTLTDFLEISIVKNPLNYFIVFIVFFLFIKMVKEKQQ